MDESAIKANEMWVNNARTIEALKTWIGLRLEKGDYDGGEREEKDRGEGGFNGKDGGDEVDRGGLYPVLNVD